MAVTVQNTAFSTPDSTSETTKTLALNAGVASGRVVLVFVASGAGNAGITTKTFAGTAMTFVDEIRTSASAGYYHSLYKLIGDANVPTGSNNIVITQSSASELYLAGYAFSGAGDIANTTKGNGTGDNTITKTVTSNGTSGLIVAGCNTNYSAPGAFTDTTGQTDVYTVTAANNSGGGASGYQAAGSGASTVFTWTSAHSPAVDWGMIATNIQVGSTNYPLTAGQGSFTLTYQTTAVTSARKIAAAVGSFVLSGQNALFAWGRGIVAGVGSFALTLQNVAVTSARKLTAAYGSFTLSGQDAAFTSAKIMSAIYGAFSLVGQTARLLLNGGRTVYSNESKNSASYTNETKNTTTFTNESKNSSSWTNEDKSQESH